MMGAKAMLLTKIAAKMEGGDVERPWITSTSYKAALDAVIQARHRNGISQRQLAERLGKPRSFVSKIESRERRLDFVEFIAVARALDLEPADFMKVIVAVVPEPVEI
jgi:ribosome-binding protein aMBF1 (putative translation factor)